MGQIFTVTKEVGAQITNFDFKFLNSDQQKQFQLFEFISENILTYRTIDAKDLAEDGSDFCLNELRID